MNVIDFDKVSSQIGSLCVKIIYPTTKLPTELNLPQANINTSRTTVNTTNIGNDLIQQMVLFKFNDVYSKLTKTEALFKRLNESEIHSKFQSVLNEDLLIKLYELQDNEFEERIRKFIALSALKDTYSSFSKTAKSSFTKSIKSRKLNFKWPTF